MLVQGTKGQKQKGQGHLERYIHYCDWSNIRYVILLKDIVQRLTGHNSIYFSLIVVEYVLLIISLTRFVPGANRYSAKSVHLLITEYNGTATGFKLMFIMISKTLLDVIGFGTVSNESYVFTNTVVCPSQPLQLPFPKHILI